MKTELMVYEDYRVEDYIPCLPKCDSCKKKILPIKSRIQDGTNAITTCFSNLKPWSRGGLNQPQTGFYDTFTTE